MSTKRERLLAELANVVDDDDLWITVGARFGKSLFFAKDRVVAKAICHFVSGSNDPLQPASREFLQEVFGYDASRERVPRWLELTRKSLHGQGRSKEAQQLDRSLRSLLEQVARKRPEGVEGSEDLAFSGLVEALPQERLFEAAATVASRHRDLAGRVEGIRSLLALVARSNEIVHAVAGSPREVDGVEDVLEATTRQAVLAGEALGGIWQERMLEPAAAAVALGAKPTNREKVRQYRERSWLVGLPRNHGTLYPAFQFDLHRKEVDAHARQVNELLGARDDPWGVASWWISSNDRLASIPRDLLRTPRAGEVVRAAHSLLEPVG